jgi:hypothetical protein
MDFERTLTIVLQGVHDRRIRYAVIGGLAMGLWGLPRATLDVDFLIHRDDLPTLHELFTRLGYQRDVSTENVSQYVHPVRPFGSIDVLHAFRPLALGMLERARPLAFPDTSLTIQVLQPEDIIGLKVQAIANNPSRRPREMLDIEALVARFHDVIDWHRLQQYYDLFDLGDDARQLRARYG